MITSTLKTKLKKYHHKAKILAAKTLYGYDKHDLIRTLHKAGVVEDDALMVHCGWRATSGFRGNVNDFIDALMETVGSRGTLAMMSMAYQGMSSYEYLKKGKPFDVRRSVSMVGIPTEIFRRRKDVIRGLHPTHSVAAWGTKAQWLVEGQGKELSPFGEESPFARLVELDGKILLYNVPFNTMTFEHFLEHQIQEHLPLPLYKPNPMVGGVIDHTGQCHKIDTLVLNEEINPLRQSKQLESELFNAKAIMTFQLSRSHFILGRTRSMVSTVHEMVQQNRGFHTLSINSKVKQF